VGFDLNMEGSVQSRMSLGREFQREGALSPHARCLVLCGMDRRWSSGERSRRDGAGRRSEGGPIMEGFVSEEKDFVLDSLWDGEPVKVLENRGDVITGVGLGKQQSSGWIYLGFWMMCHKDTIVIVNPGGDEGMDQSFSSRWGEWWAETGNILIERRQFWWFVWRGVQRRGRCQTWTRGCGCVGRESEWSCRWWGRSCDWFWWEIWFPLHSRCTYKEFTKCINYWINIKKDIGDNIITTWTIYNNNSDNEWEC